MFFKNKIINFFIITNIFLFSLQGVDKVITQDEKEQQIENALILTSSIGLLTNVSEKYFQKNNSNIKIRCKNCKKRELSIGEFEGCLIAETIKAIADGVESFSKTKIFLDNYIKLLSDDVACEKLLDFMLDTSNNMKQNCTNCYDCVWEKIS
ncbi:hypothetical protein K9L05_03990 [Candidatus Babeliales bacterium]|nr:hypothetical protein [Candidatus Babeliales bacterium]MCF7899778.1 hypothetical protein [Candidatus Babeliales bacterium]